MSKKYFIITFGCAMNFSDSERIAAILENQGCRKAPSKYEADLVVIVACAIRQHAVDRIYGNVKELKVKSQKLKVKIIITGCLLENDILKFKNMQEKKQFNNITIKQLKEFSTQKNINAFFGITPKYQFRDRANVPIMTGCDNFCSYCAVPYTRGREYSRPAEEIIREISRLVKNGCREITLLGQNVNSYAKFKIPSQLAGRQSSKFKKNSNIQYLISNISANRQINFPLLLHLINAIPGDFKIKFLTSHPKDMSDELIEAIADCEKVDKEKLHLPVQSGDDAILDKMNRKYTVEHYKNLIQKIRAKLPDIKITTDVIVGFPGETEEQFENTVQLFEEIGFSAAYVSCYSPRSGTVAAGMADDVAREEKKRRKVELERIATD